MLKRRLAVFVVIVAGFAVVPAASQAKPPTGTSWNAQRLDGTSWNAPSPDGTSWNAPSPDGTSWNGLPPD